MKIQTQSATVSVSVTVEAETSYDSQYWRRAHRIAFSDDYKRRRYDRELQQRENDRQLLEQLLDDLDD
jgi:hypothetical protein